MDGDVIFFWGASEGEWMPLPVRDFGAREEDILSRANLRPLLLNLDFHDFTRVLDHFRNICDMATSYLPEDPLDDEDDSTREPITPEHTDNVIITCIVVRSDHAEHAV